MLVRPATAADLEVVTDLRLAFLADHRRVEPSRFPSGFRATTSEFLRRHEAAEEPGPGASTRPRRRLDPDGG